MEITLKPILSKKHIIILRNIIALLLLGFVLLAISNIFIIKPFNKPSTPLVTSSFNCTPAIKLATIQPIKSGLWYETNTWPDGNLPTNNDDVIVPEGINLTMAGTCRARTITVMGKLSAINSQEEGAWIDLRTKYIMVMGANAELEIGTKNQPYNSPEGCTITLTGTNENELIPGTNVHSKAIMVMNDAKLTIQGKVQNKTWTKINQSVNPGDNVLTFMDDINNQWNIGDKIVIASSDFNMNEAEEVTIKSFINANTVELEENLQYAHYGQLQQYTHGVDTSINWTLDERAEVGLLSHNITIQGDMSNGSLAKGYGGHIMIMDNAQAYVSGAELYHMGQKGEKGRYPFHWHGLQDASGQYFDKNSVHHTFNRAVTIHATSNVDVIGNVAYDNLVHAYFFEDGTEEGVDMLFNLGLVTRRPAPQDALLPSDIFNKRNSSGPSTFWITHPNNNINGNIAGGSDGSGIWYSPFNNPNGLFYDGSVNAHLAIPDGFLDNNIAHSNKHGYIFGAGVIHGDASETPNQNGWIRPPDFNNPTVRDITVYKNHLGVYHRTENDDKFISTLIDFVIADNRVGDATTWKTNYDRILWVTASDNFSADYGNEGVVGGGTNAVHIVYDGPVLTTNSHFGGSTPEGYSLFDQWGANIKYTSHLFKNTTAAPGAIRYNWRDGNFRNRPVWSLATVRDVDGVFSGRANSTISLDIPYLMDASTVIKTDNGAQTDLKFAYVEISPSNEGNNRPPASVLRADGPQYSDNGEIEGYPIPVVVDRTEMRSRFVLKREIPRRLRFNIYSLGPGEDIMMEVPNVPSSIRLDNVNQIADKSIEGLEASNANGVSWYWKDGTAYIKYRGLPGFVFTKSGRQANFSLCLDGNCNGGSNAIPIVLSSYDERDTRGMVVKNGSNDIEISNITHSNGRDQYTVTRQGGNDTCAEYALRFGAQNWRDMGRLNIQGTGLVASEIYLYNSERKEQRRVGIACNNTRFSINIPNNDGFYDNIAEISIKTCESSISGNAQQIEVDRIIMGNSVGNPTAQNCGNPTPTDCNGTPNGSAYRDDCGICVGGSTGATECNQAPTISFSSPMVTQFDEGANLGVVVSAQGTISNIRLYLNNEFVREEGAAPYEWGTANPNPDLDPQLLNLVIGTYELKAEAMDDTDQVIATETITITVSPTDTDGDGYFDLEEEEDCRSITDPSDLSFDFNGEDENFEFNKLTPSSFTISGAWQLTANNSNDPFMYRGNLSFTANEVFSISVRIRSERTGPIQLFWATSGVIFAGDKVNTQMYTVADQWQEITFDVGSDPAWSGNTITALRLDFVPDANANVTHWIDWMRGPNGNDPCTLSIDPIENENIVTLYPNPVKNNLLISGNTAGKTVRIYDLLGAVRTTKKLTENGNKINLSNFAAGLYIIRILDLNKTASNDAVFKILKVD